MSEKEMIERYIYEVVKRVPQAVKEEIRMELQELIELPNVIGMKIII